MAQNLMTCLCIYTVKKSPRTETAVYIQVYSFIVQKKYCLATAQYNEKTVIHTVAPLCLPQRYVLANRKCFYVVGFFFTYSVASKQAKFYCYVFEIIYKRVL